MKCHILLYGKNKKNISKCQLLKTLPIIENLAENCMQVVFNDAYAIYFLISFIKLYIVGIHLNCLYKSRQFKWITTTYDFIKQLIKLDGL